MLSGKAIWFASYPKSGNTWLRLWLEAYRRNGILDINDIRICVSDAGGPAMQAVSPWPLAVTPASAQLYMRPAMLFQLFALQRAPFYCKTHCANIATAALPALIPPELTDKAIYVVRDPRQVAVSFSTWMGQPIENIVTAMNRSSFHIGRAPQHSISLLSTWSENVSSWVNEAEFPVHVVKYEDMLSEPEKILESCVDFLGLEKDKKLIRKAVKATEISKLQKLEEANGFSENMSGGEGKQAHFFHAGGTRWQDELGPKWIAQIENDHREVMTQLGYLDD